MLDRVPQGYWARSTALFGLRHAQATLLWADDMGQALKQRPGIEHPAAP